MYALLARLEANGIHFTIGRHRPDTVMLTLTLVGERVEIDVFEDGRMEVSRFTGNEDVVGDASLVDELVRMNSD
ncbi:hypothetical protein [Piscinibacterium candidicorallinum]|uniref:Uncharacterized protein n=1 Tax=Piscinibacterium candidicorallinum TaxID=1793872 RepID=A0ABV7H2I3_9BURK